MDVQIISSQSAGPIEVLRYYCNINVHIILSVNICFYKYNFEIICINVSLIGGGDCKRKGRKAQGVGIIFRGS